VLGERQPQRREVGMCLHVQRLADILAAEGFVDYADNPNHRRAKLVRLTDQGHHSLKALHIRQAEWANHLAAGLDAESLHAAGLILSTLRQRLDAEEEALS
ncbi:MAG: hypothetical protein K2Q10_09185, partial [Rhodospirillales bacterium]|nr:hypothetical protein [Rhodospirillales bacterium]